MQHHSLASLGLLLSAGSSLALDLNLNDPNSIKSAAKSIASNIVNLYGNPSTPGFIPGLFGQPYYFYEDGLAFDSLVNYWALTGDNSYVNLTRDALVWQLSPSNDYMPPNQTKNLGNDDQSTWGLAAMTAAEKQFPAPSNNLSWAQVAQNVFNTQAARWDAETCNGGLRWQIYSFNAGYSYKNSESNGNLAQLAARLARFSGGNQTYSDWASKILSWSKSAGLISGQGNVFDGTDSTDNCSSVNRIQWTSTAGTWLTTAAYLSNVTNDSVWRNLSQSIVSMSGQIFTTNSSVLFESACAPQKNCDVDQLAFRAVLARALANAKAFAAAGGNQSVSNNITQILQASAKGAAAQCSGGSNSTVCGSNWVTGVYDGTSGLGQYLSALEIILANLPQTQPTTTNSTTVNTTNTINAPASSSPVAKTNGASTLASSAFLSLGGLALAAML